MNINGLVGYQLITSGNFALDIFSGLGFKSNSADIVANTGDDFDDLNENLPLGTGPKFTLGFNFGLAFFKAILDFLDSLSKCLSLLRKKIL